MDVGFLLASLVYSLRILVDRFGVVGTLCSWFLCLTFSPSQIYRSGLLNFCAVAVALCDFGYKPLGIRLDSGDLAYLSNRARDAFVKISQQFALPWFAELNIVASNDINEETILSLNDQDHQINCFGIGTHLGGLDCLAWSRISTDISLSSHSDVSKATGLGLRVQISWDQPPA